ncbi:MAG: hypothetical protein QXK89_10470 [Candidatus Bathyarchaeia archaeon]
MTLMVEIVRDKGSPLILVNGKVIPTILAYTTPKYWSDFRRAGIRVITYPISIGWVGPGKFDYTETDKQIEEFLSVDPETLILPRVSFPGSNNDWWCKLHPEELVRLSNGERGSGHSSASLIWREEASNALLRFIEHVEKSDYSDNIIGYHVCDGHFSEWFAWDSANFEKEVHNLRHVCSPGYSAERCPTPWPDYSEPMVRAFREWLYRKYQGDVGALRKAWQDPNVDFSTAEIPSRVERVRSGNFLIRDPARCMKIIDYDMCLQDVHTDTLLKLCRVAKEKVGAGKIIGVFYGYTWTGFFRGFYMQNAGHLAFSKILHSPCVDFIAAPCEYDNRGADGVCFSQSIPETAVLHGKLFFNEVDPKTFLTDPQMKWHHKEDLKPRSLDETIEIMKRNYSYTHSIGVGMWWTDLFGQGWYHHEEIIWALTKIQKIEERLLDFDHSSNREIAVILDEKSLLYERPCQNLMMSLRSVWRQWELAYIGAPFDTYLQSDFIDHEETLRKYKMYIFPNNIHMSGDEMEKIKDIVRKDKKVVLWIWAPGFIMDNCASVTNIGDLTGVKVNCENIEARLHVDITNYVHPITANLPKGSCFGPEMSRWHTVLFKESGFIEDDPNFTIGPVFYSDDPEAIILGRISINDKPGLVVKEFDDWTSIYSSTLMISKDIIRNIARFAGVHLYVESGDLVYSNKHFLCIYPRLGGKKVINLPEPKTVIDLWNDNLVAKNAHRFEVDMEPNKAYMYLLK